MVPVPASVWAEVQEHERQFPSVAVTLPWREPEVEKVTMRLLVTGEGGRLYSGDLFGKVVWQGAFREAGLTFQKGVDGMHALRHLYASVLLAMGVSIKELAEYLGHADPAFTLRPTRTSSRPAMSGRESRSMRCSDGLRRLTAWRRPDLEIRAVYGRRDGSGPDHQVRCGHRWPGRFSQVTSAPRRSFPVICGR